MAKVIVVTGASRGIGLAVSKYLLAQSHKLILVSRSEKDLRPLKDAFPDQVEYLAADLTNHSTAPIVTELAISSFGRLDGIVINHAVLSPMTRIENSSIEEWKQLYDANFFSALALVKAAIPHLRKSKGRVIFTSSGAALHAYASWGAYGSSKAAMNSLAQHIAVEEPEIASVAVSPGRVDTDMQKLARETGEMSEKDRTGFISAFHEGRLNKPELPGQVIAKLAISAKLELQGRYLSWNSPELAEYREEQ